MISYVYNYLCLFIYMFILRYHYNCCRRLPPRACPTSTPSRAWGRGTPGCTPAWPGTWWGGPTLLPTSRSTLATISWYPSQYPPQDLCRDSCCYKHCTEGHQNIDQTLVWCHIMLAIRYHRYKRTLSNISTHCHWCQESRYYLDCRTFFIKYLSHTVATIQKDLKKCNFWGSFVCVSLVWSN